MGSPLLAELQGFSPGQKESHVKLSLVNASAAWVPCLCSGVCTFCATGQDDIPKSTGQVEEGREERPMASGVV